METPTGVSRWREGTGVLTGMDYRAMSRGGFGMELLELEEGIVRTVR